MKQKAKAAIALSVASVMACGLLAGCDLVTTDAKKDYEQVIAEVNISKSDEFQKNTSYTGYQEIFSDEPIYKRDMVASFVSSGSSVMNSYGWTYRDTFDAIKDSLVNRQVYVQYAKLFLLTQTDENGDYLYSEEGKPERYTIAGYRAELASASDEMEKTLAGLRYFLTEEEETKAEYGLRVSFNSSLDSIEEGIIDYEDEHDHSETVRTTPTGVGTENEDYVPESYEIYTGTENAVGSYEKLDGSTAYTRRQAYATFLTNVRSSGLLDPDEDTTKVEELSYFKRELKSSYETALINKLADAFEEDESKNIDPAWVEERFNETLSNQSEGFKKESISVDDGLDGMSDTSFVLTAPEAGYGFVINILLPFSAQDQQALDEISQDKDDDYGNKYGWRASILYRLRATDQRGTWFTSEEDYSYDASEVTDAYKGTAGDRKYLFFKDSFSEKEDESTRYDALKNYYGKYTYNGKVEATEEEDGHTSYKLTPNPISIDGFIDEMEGYLNDVLGAGSAVPGSENHKGDKAYYTKPVEDYYVKEGDELTSEVDYSSFVYYEGSVNFDGGFDANHLFLEGSPENKALSVINELSFAYNTDTAGLNTYLGYAVSAGKTNFVGEFEYAAHEVCKKGAGHYIVVPSDYGWHIIYCTFSFSEDLFANTPEGGIPTPFSFNQDDVKTEGTFSYLFYEAQKSAAAATYSQNRQSDIINKFSKNSVTVYEDRYEDLSNLDLQS